MFVTFVIFVTLVGWWKELSSWVLLLVGGSSPGSIRGFANESVVLNEGVVANYSASRSALSTRGMSFFDESSAGVEQIASFRNGVVEGASCSPV